jgi:phage-related protein
MRELRWVGSSRRDLRDLPRSVRFRMAYALLMAQQGTKHPRAKPLLGFGGAGVLEVVEDDDGNTYRAVYTVTLPDAVYVLHVFQKKARRGSETPRGDLDLIRERLKQAERESADQTKREGEEQ